MNAKWLVLPLVAVMAACGSGGNNPDPKLIPGGGISSGAINGTLHVYVLDGYTKNAVSGAALRIGAPADAAPLTGTTDSTGLISFKDGRLVGPQTVTATASGHAAATWFGVNGANVTMAISPDQVDVPTASVEGTIDGFANLPDPAQGHYLVAAVAYSFLHDLGAPENSIKQTKKDGNICIRSQTAKDCNWKLTTRAGAQFHFAIILDGDAHGTPADSSDDTYTVIGYAVKMGLSIDQNQTITGEVLTMINIADLKPATVSFQSAPTGLDLVNAVSAIDLGDPGLMVMALPPLTPTMVTTKVPALTGPFASGKYLFMAAAAAQGVNGEKLPSSTIMSRNVDLGQTLNFGAWLPPPTDVAASGGTYSFTPAAGETVATAEFVDANKAVSWRIALLDGSTSFTLPSLSPDALPAGENDLRVTASDIPEFVANEFTVDSLSDILARSSTNKVHFTH